MQINYQSHGSFAIFKQRVLAIAHTFSMASQVNWKEMLEGRYPPYKVEVNAFLDSIEISSSTEIAMDYIYQAIKGNPNVGDNLKLLYHEAVYGCDKEVKKQIKSRVANFRHALR